MGSFEEDWNTSADPLAHSPDSFEAAWNAVDHPSAPADESMWSKFGQSILSGPSQLLGAVKEIPSGIENTIQTLFSPKQAIASGTAEKTARGWGNLAAGTAGAGVGAEAGAALGTAILPGVGTAAGTILGGAAGFGAGLLGFDWANQATGADAPTTPTEDWTKFVENTGAGISIGALAKGAGKAADVVATKVPEVAKAIDRKSLGTRQSDYGTASDIRTIDMPESEGGIQTYTRQALDDLLGSGKLGTSRNPQTLLKAINDQSNTLRSQIAGRVTEYDAIDPTTGERINPPVQPDFSNAIDYIRSGKVPADQVPNYMNRLTKLAENIDKYGKGNLTYIQAQKVAMGKGWTPTEGVDPGFTRAIYTDLKNTVESVAPEVGPLNAELGKYRVVDKITNRALKAKENASPLTKARDVLYTTGGVGAPMIAGSVMGGPGGAALGAILGLTGKALASPTGQAKVAGALRTAANLAAPISSAIGSVFNPTTEPGSVPPVSPVTEVFAPKVDPVAIERAARAQRFAEVSQELANQSQFKPVADLGSGAETALPSSGAPESLRPPQSTGPTGTVLPEGNLATTSPLSTSTDTVAPSYKYLPTMSEGEVLANPDFINHYQNTVKQAPEFERLINSIAGDGKVVTDIKKPETAAGKILRKVKEGNPGYTEQNLGDIVRGHVVVSDFNKAADTLARLHDTGTVHGEIENYMMRPNAMGYQGINANVKLPGGGIGEIQIHTPRTLAIQDALHPLYEEFRSLDKASLGKIMSLVDKSRQVASRADLQFRGELPPPEVKNPIQYAKISDLKPSQDVPQWKMNADAKTGVTKELGGDFETRGLGPIQVWKRNNGNLEVISGRHRLDKATKAGETHLPVQIYHESQGFTANDAMMLDRELNIMKGHGDIVDFTNHFRESGLTEAEAAKKGLLNTAKGRAGWAIGKNATEDVYSLFKAGKLTEAEAQAISEAAPKDAKYQRVATKAVLDGVDVKEIPGLVQDLKSTEGQSQATGPEQGDIFGNSDSALNAAIEQSKIATEKQQALTKEIRAIQNPVRDAESRAYAAKHGVTAQDANAVQASVKELKAELERWKNWRKYPDLREQVKAAMKAPAKQDNSSIGAVFAKPATENTPEPKTAVQDIFTNRRKPRMSKETKAVEAQIDQDPYYSALYEAESGRNPKAKNPNSSATGGFQFIKATAKNLGLSDPTDLGASFEAVKRLTNENAQALGRKDPGPDLLYAAHYLGADVARRWLDGDTLTAKEQAQVNYLESKALPDFMKIYNRITEKNGGELA